MRGIHDGKLQDGKTTEEKIKILEEVLPIFNAGLKVPKGTTIMWTNDNFGYVRRVSGEKEFLMRWRLRWPG